MSSNTEKVNYLKRVVFVEEPEWLKPMQTLFDKLYLNNDDKGVLFKDLQKIAKDIGEIISSKQYRLLYSFWVFF